MDTPEVCNGDNDDQIPLPGFRFHPTDEELVNFYLRRKVDKRPISLELIKQIDIYKHDPWDLPYESRNVGDKEWYFYCKRGRKYKNSIRPNRVTGSGFWKATGIDKPVYSNGGDGNECIGLKKTLVYYRGSAGKGSKTDWMMHEFRLPPTPTNQKHHPCSKNFAEEAEIWTLCRIFKRNVSCKKYNWSKQTANKNTKVMNNDVQQQIAGEKSSGEISYMNFSCESMIIQNEQKPLVLIDPNYQNNQLDQWNNNNYQFGNSSPVSSGIISAPINFPTNQLDINDFFTDSNWDELRSVVNMF